MFLTKEMQVTEWHSQCWRFLVTNQHTPSQWPGDSRSCIIMFYGINYLKQIIKDVHSRYLNNRIVRLNKIPVFQNHLKDQFQRLHKMIRRAKYACPKRVEVQVLDSSFVKKKKTTH
ncbi:hypothetical protein QQ045_018690 [Rhodiola kirilowii]